MSIISLLRQSALCKGVKNRTFQLSDNYYLQFCSLQTRVSTDFSLCFDILSLSTRVEWLATRGNLTLYKLHIICCWAVGHDHCSLFGFGQLVVAQFFLLIFTAELHEGNLMVHWIPCIVIPVMWNRFFDSALKNLETENESSHTSFVSFTYICKLGEIFYPGGRDNC